MVVKRGYRKFAPQVVAVFILPTCEGHDQLSRVTVLAQPSGSFFGALEERNIPRDQRGPGKDLTSLPTRVAHYLIDGGEASSVEMMRNAYNRAIGTMKHEPKYRDWTIMRCFRLAMQEALQTRSNKEVVAPKEEGK